MSEDQLRPAMIALKLWSVKKNVRMIPTNASEESQKNWGWVDADVRPSAISLIHKVEGKNFRVIIEGFEFVVDGDSCDYDKVRDMVMSYG